MEKIFKKVQLLDFALDWGYGISIEEIKKDIKLLEDIGATGIDITLEDEWGNDFLSIVAFTNRLETDKEFSERLNLNNKEKEDQKIHELKMLEILKNKYEGLDK